MRLNQFSKNAGTGFEQGLSSEITPQAVYAQRRDWLKQIAAGAAGLSMATWASREALAQVSNAAVVRAGKLAPLTGALSRVSGANTMEKITTYTDATTHIHTKSPQAGLCAQVEALRSGIYRRITPRS